MKWRSGCVAPKIKIVTRQDVVQARMVRRVDLLIVQKRASG